LDTSSGRVPGRAPLAHATLEAENTALKEELARERKQRIALNTRVRNLNGELTAMRKWHDTEMAKRGKMPLGTFTAVVKCLHPDERLKRTPAQIDKACGLFTQWKKSQDKGGAR